MFSYTSAQTFGMPPQMSASSLIRHFRHRMYGNVYAVTEATNGTATSVQMRLRTVTTAPATCRGSRVPSRPDRLDTGFFRCKVQWESAVVDRFIEYPGGLEGRELAGAFGEPKC